MEKDYFDARFDGLEKLMAAQDKNLTGYIGGVNASVKEVRQDLQEHKESADAHGAAASNRSGGHVLGWLSLVVSIVAVIAVVVPLLQK